MHDTCSTCGYWRTKDRRNTTAECSKIVELVGMPPWNAESLTTDRSFGCVLHQPLPGAARARTTDPETSHEAAARVLNITPRRIAVLRLLVNDYDDLADVTLIDRYEMRRGMWQLPAQTSSSIRTRRSELVKLGLVEKKGETVIRNRRHTTWGPTAAGVAKMDEIDGAL